MSNSRKLTGNIWIKHTNPNQTTTEYGDQGRHLASVASKCRSTTTLERCTQMSNALLQGQRNKCSPGDEMPGHRQNLPPPQKHNWIGKVDGDGWQNRPRTHWLDSEVYTCEKQQAICSAGPYSPENARLCIKSRQNWIDDFYRWL